MGCTDPLRRLDGGVGAPRQCPLESVASYLIYADVRLHIPMTHRNDVIRYHSPEEEIAFGPACWLWDYLRRSGLAGFFLPLSGGIDSSSTACLIASMCYMVVEACEQGNAQVLNDARRLAGQGDDYIPTSPQEFANHIFCTEVPF